MRRGGYLAHANHGLLHAGDHLPVAKDEARVGRLVGREEYRGVNDLPKNLQPPPPHTLPER